VTSPVHRRTDTQERRRAVIVAGHVGDVDTARRGLLDDESVVRASALTALERLGALDETTLVERFIDRDAEVRRRAAEVAARHHGVDLMPLLHDDDALVVEMAAWALNRLVVLAVAVIMVWFGTKIAIVDMGQFRMPSLIPMTAYTAAVPFAGALVALFAIEQLVNGWKNGFEGPEDNEYMGESPE